MFNDVGIECLNVSNPKPKHPSSGTLILLTIAYTQSPY